jgi:hypothetical protein
MTLERGKKLLVFSCYHLNYQTLTDFGFGRRPRWIILNQHGSSFIKTTGKID